MEEMQIRDFVHRVVEDEELRKKLASDPESVIMREDFSPRVARIVERLIPHLTITPWSGILIINDTGPWNAS